MKISINVPDRTTYIDGKSLAHPFTAPGGVRACHIDTDTGEAGIEYDNASAERCWAHDVEWVKDVLAARREHRVKTADPDGLTDGIEQRAAKAFDAAVRTSHQARRTEEHSSAGRELPPAEDLAAWEDIRHGRRPTPGKAGRR